MENNNADKINGLIKSVKQSIELHKKMQELQVKLIKAILYQKIELKAGESLVFNHENFDYAIILTRDLEKFYRTNKKYECIRSMTLQEKLSPLTKLGY